MLETERLSDKQLDFHSMNVDEQLECEGVAAKYPSITNAEFAVMLTELRAYRAGEIAPEGKVLVREEELRAVLSHAAHGFEVGSDDDRHPCVALRGLRDKRPHCPSFGECTSSDTNGDVCYGDCLAAPPCWPTSASRRSRTPRTSGRERGRDGDAQHSYQSSQGR